MADASANEEFDSLLAAIGDGVPDGAQYQRMSSLILDFPEARALALLDPFSPGYKSAAMELYLALRGRNEDGYDAARDERAATKPPENLWTGLVPWSFRDARMSSEHLFAWGHILAHLDLPAGGSVLEYGPGSGQLLLSLARMGYRACGVDIDAVALRTITAQAEHLQLAVETEQASFGDGFAGQTFDCVIFYEAFHHAFDFDRLLSRLHDRIKPGGRILLCGEPVVPAEIDGIPYPWGPRLDALSVFCIRRFGWMELGFTHGFLMKLFDVAGWQATFHPFPNCGRAHLYVLRQPGGSAVAPQAAASPSEHDRLKQELRDTRTALAAICNSTSWKVTRPLRAIKRIIDRTRH